MSLRLEALRRASLRSSPGHPISSHVLPCPLSLVPDFPMQFRARAIHVGNEADPQTRAVVPPIHLASTFVQPGAGPWAEFDYSRSGNPTRKAFETTLGSLEGGAAALAFSSGMAAIHCTTMMLESGDHVLAAPISTAARIACCTRFAIAAESA